MFAPAKINLFLHVTGKLHNGYHMLESLMMPIDVNDVVHVEEDEGLELEVSGEFADNTIEEDNDIVIKAAKSLAKYADNNNLGAKIIMQKNIPVGAGLGGGSADAAAALKLLNDLWGLNYSTETLAQIGVGLGADVPFAIYNRPAFVSGIGEKIKKTEIPQLNILLVYPNKVLSTADVFQHAPITFSEAGCNEIEGEFLQYLQGCSNDLEENALSIMPEVGNVLAAIAEQSGCVISRMTGSGSTCFGIFDTSFALKNAELEMTRKYPKWWVRRLGGDE